MTPEMLFAISVAVFLILAIAIIYILRGYSLSRRSEGVGGVMEIRDCHNLCASAPDKGPSVSCETLCLGHWGA
jgi:hypothetical protein